MTTESWSNQKGVIEQQRQSERIQLRGLCAIRITSTAEPHFAVSETAPFPASIFSAAISEGEKMTIEN